MIRLERRWWEVGADALLLLFQDFLGSVFNGDCETES
jgi:hypothetical protein